MVQYRDIDLPTGVQLRVNNGDLTVPSNNLIVGGTISGSSISEGGVSLSAKYLGLTAKAADSDKLNNLSSTQFVRADTDFIATGTIRAKSIGNDFNGTYIPFPYGGSYQTQTATITGALKITLPQSWSSTMLRFAIDIFDYMTNESFTVYVAGYNYSVGSSWVNATAYIIGNSTSRDFTVRFGHDGTKCCIYVGEVNTVWDIPQIVIRDFFAGYAGNAFTSWDEGWAIGFATSFGTITATVSDCMVKSSYSKNSLQLNGQPASYYALASHTHTGYLATTGKAADSNLLNGIDSAKFVRNDTANSIAGLVTITAGGLQVNTGGISSATTIQYGLAASRGTLSYGSGVITLEASSANTSVDIKSTGTGTVRANGNTIYHAGNLTVSELVRNNATGQSVTGDFSIAGNSTLFIGAVGTNSGSLMIKGSGANKIQITGANTTKDSAATIYMNALGHAQFSGTVTANKIQVANSEMVSNLNAQLLAGKGELEFTKTASIVETGGYGVQSGLIVSAQTPVPNLSVRIAAGVVYTDTGRRYDIVQTDQAITQASTTYGRRDIIFIYGSKNAAGGASGALEGTIGYKEGTPSATPADPAIPTGAVRLARITLIASMGTIQNANITNLIEWRPIIHDGAGFHIRQPFSIESNITSDTSTVTITKPIQGTGWATSLYIQPGQQSIVWTHNLGLSSYVIEFSTNVPNRHIYWSNKGANTITIWIDDTTDVIVTVDAVITAI